MVIHSTRTIIQDRCRAFIGRAPNNFRLHEEVLGDLVINVLKRSNLHQEFRDTLRQHNLPRCQLLQTNDRLSLDEVSLKGGSVILFGGTARDESQDDLRIPLIALGQGHLENGRAPLTHIIKAYYFNVPVIVEAPGASAIVSNHDLRGRTCGFGVFRVAQDGRECLAALKNPVIVNLQRNQLLRLAGGKQENCGGCLVVGRIQDTARPCGAI